MRRRITRKLIINAKSNGEMTLLPTTTTDETMETYVQTKMNAGYFVINDD